MAALLRDDTTEAGAAFRQHLELARELVVLPFEALRGLAAVAVRHGDLERAARLYGAAVAHSYAAPGHPVDVRIHDTFIAPARARHAGEAWDAAQRAGAQLGFR